MSTDQSAKPPRFLDAAGLFKNGDYRGVTGVLKVAPEQNPTAAGPSKEVIAERKNPDLWVLTRDGVTVGFASKLSNGLWAMYDAEMRTRLTPLIAYKYPSVVAKAYQERFR